VHYAAFQFGRWNVGRVSIKYERTLNTNATCNCFTWTYSGGGGEEDWEIDFSIPVVNMGRNEARSQDRVRAHARAHVARRGDAINIFIAAELVKTGI